MSGQNYYQLLGIDATATDAEIRRAYHRLSLQYHPDKRRAHDAFADQLYRRIQEAYETLTCPEKRCLYDFVGSFAALAEFTASLSCAVPVPAQRSRSAVVAAEAPGGLWSRSSSGEPLHSIASSSSSWGASSSLASSRLSPCPSFDTHLSSSPGGSGQAAGGLAASVPGLGLGHPGGDRVGGDVAAGGDPATVTSSSGVSFPEAAVTAAAGLGPSSAGAAAPSSDCAAHPRHQLQQQQHPDSSSFLPPQLKLRLPNPPEPDAATSSSSLRAAAAGTTAGGGGGDSPITSPGTLLGKRREPGTDAAHPHPHTGPHPHPGPHPPEQHPQPHPGSCSTAASGFLRGPCRPAPQPQPHPLQSHSDADAASGDRSFGGLTLRAAAAAASGRRFPPSPSPPSSSSADIHHRLLLTLEEMYSGCVKQLRLARRVYRPGPEADGLSSSPPGPVPLSGAAAEALATAADSGADLVAGVGAGGSGGATSCWGCVEELFRVVVQPGWREGTKVTFTGKGDELPCGARGDMVLVVAQAAHGRYERRGNDLHTVVAVPLVDALTGGHTDITTLDGRRLVMRLGPACLQPFSECVVKGEGMPLPPGSKAARGARGSTATGAATATAAAPAPRGDLHVRFEVSFPADLTTEQKAELRRALLQQ